MDDAHWFRHIAAVLHDREQSGPHTESSSQYASAVYSGCRFCNQETPGVILAGQAQLVRKDKAGRKDLFS